MYWIELIASQEKLRVLSLFIGLSSLRNRLFRVLFLTTETKCLDETLWLCFSNVPGKYLRNKSALHRFRITLTEFCEGLLLTHFKADKHGGCCKANFATRMKQIF